MDIFKTGDQILDEPEIHEKVKEIFDNFNKTIDNDVEHDIEMMFDITSSFDSGEMVSSRYLERMARDQKIKIPFEHARSTCAMNVNLRYQYYTGLERYLLVAMPPESITVGSYEIPLVKNTNTLPAVGDVGTFVVDSLCGDTYVVFGICVDVDGDYITINTPEGVIVRTLRPLYKSVKVEDNLMGKLQTLLDFRDKIEAHYVEIDRLKKQISEVQDKRTAFLKQTKGII